MSKVFTASEVAQHKTAKDLFITIDGDVYDLTNFQDDHPGEQLFFPPIFAFWDSSGRELDFPLTPTPLA